MDGFNGDTKIIYSIANNNVFIKSLNFKDAFDKLVGKNDIEVFINNPYNGTRIWNLTKFYSFLSQEWFEFVIEGLCDRANWTKFKLTPNQTLPVLRDNILSDLPTRSIKPGDKLLFDASLYTMSEYDFSQIMPLTVKETVYKRYTENCYSAKVLNEENPYFVLANGLITHR